MLLSFATRDAARVEGNIVPLAVGGCRRLVKLNYEGFRIALAIRGLSPRRKGRWRQSCRSDQDKCARIDPPPMCRNKWRLSALPCRRRRPKTGPKDFLASILKQKDQTEWLLNVWRRSWHSLLKRIADKEQKEINSLSPFVRARNDGQITAAFVNSRQINDELIARAKRRNVSLRRL